MTTCVRSPKLDLEAGISLYLRFVWRRRDMDRHVPDFA